jgi:lysylphosphatidylglycerol synthetase-like protein (DUF2156 family)
MKEKRLTSTQLVSYFIWGNLILSQGFLLIILSLVPGNEARTDPGLDALPMIFSILAFILGIASLICGPILSRFGQLSFTILLIRWTLAEAVSICGFAMAMTLKNPELSYPFIAAGTLLLLFAFPKREL